MSYATTDLATRIQRITADIISQMKLEDLLRRSDIDVYAKVEGAIGQELQGYISWVADQIQYDKCDDDQLLRYAAYRGMSPNKGTPATGSASAAGVDASVALPAGTLFQSLSGVQYEATADAVVAAPNISVMLEATTAGTSGNLSAGETIFLVSPLDGIPSTFTTGVISDGADDETLDEFRARFLKRVRQPIQGGNLTDYENWALACSGVTRAWATRGEMGAGTVTLRFVRDDDGPGAAIIPSADELAAVSAYIDPLRPAGCKNLYVVAPVPVPLNFIISGLDPATSDVQSAVAAELSDLIQREASPGRTLLLTHIRQAISAAAGEIDHVLVSPAANAQCNTGELFVMGSVTWG